jgi:hypothetical protein
MERTESDSMGLHMLTAINCYLLILWQRLDSKLLCRENDALGLLVLVGCAHEVVARWEKGMGYEQSWKGFKECLGETNFDTFWNRYNKTLRTDAQEQIFETLGLGYSGRRHF